MDVPVVDIAYHMRDHVASIVEYVEHVEYGIICIV